MLRRLVPACGAALVGVHGVQNRPICQEAQKSTAAAKLGPPANPTTSFWLADKSIPDQNPPTKDATVRTLPGSADVVIIGAGLSGTSVAYHVLKKQAEVEAAQEIAENEETEELKAKQEKQVEKLQAKQTEQLEKLRKEHHEQQQQQGKEAKQQPRGFEALAENAALAEGKPAAPPAPTPQQLRRKEQHEQRQREADALQLQQQGEMQELANKFYVQSAKLQQALAQNRKPHLEVLLLDARGVASGASGRNGGLLNPSSFWELPLRVKEHGLVDGLRYALLENATRDAIHSFAEEHALDIDLQVGKRAVRKPLESR
jgi:hypothetical protein